MSHRTGNCAGHSFENHGDLSAASKHAGEDEVKKNVLKIETVRGVGSGILCPLFFGFGLLF